MANPSTSPQSARELPKAVVKQMTALTTSGFGLVAALAWNEVVKELIDTYIRPYIGPDSGLVSLLIYAIAITCLAVTVTLYLVRLEQKVSQLNDKLQDTLKRKIRKPAIASNAKASSAPRSPNPRR